MEACGVFHDEEWESLSKMFSCEDSNFLLNSNGSFNIFSNAAQPASTFLADHGSSSLPSSNYNLDHTNSFYCEISQESSNSSEMEGTLFAENGDIHPYSNGTTVDFVDQSVPVFSDDQVMQEILQLKAELWEMDNIMINPVLNTQTTPELNNVGSCNIEMQQINLKRKCEKSEDINDSSDQSPKKKARVSRNTQKHNKKNKKSTVQKISNDEAGNGQSASTCSSEEADESNAKGKADAQSLYAKKRRERINERLRILQNLVPNGTKVDISTMLEEAVHYVKFLQLQIKLLSSDDMWMYAPIAYNGMDMGLYHKINNLPNLWLQN